jgi:Dyp-type peroxidase family
VAHRLQDGIAFEPDTRPSPCYRLVLMNVADATSPAASRNALAAVLYMLGALADGRVRELEGQTDRHTRSTGEQFSGLRVLIGYGRRFFDGEVHNPPLTRELRPDYLSYLPRRPAPFPRIPWSEGSLPNAGEADLAIQLTAERAAAVNCGAVEVWKLLTDEGLPLEIVSSFDGFGRYDGRGWLEFHDGVSNIESSQRLEALQAPPFPTWMGGGTYMAFLRLAVDLAAWRTLERREQELLVGRDKLTGAALVAVARDEEGRPIPMAAAAPTTAASKEDLADWREPPQTVDPLLEASHIHRANQNRASPAAARSLRMFRQGYDFLDGFERGHPALGLNFVSFQGDPASIYHVLHLQGWLGDVNFGGPSPPGDDELRSPTLVSALAGGLYAVPPVAEPFPGAVLFDH